jgi:1-deoxy-D-xylulose-5-phosphate reductoisomerase
LDYMKQVLVVGATGSIGRQTLDIAARHADDYRIVALSAHHDQTGLLSCIDNPVVSSNCKLCLSGRQPSDARIGYTGADGLRRMIIDSTADIVVNAAAGADGLASSIAALESGKDLALANKETIVMAGRLIIDLARKASRRILPVDSEHAAIFSMIERLGRHTIKSVILTASGGAFRDTALQELASMTAVAALAHPTWSMGTKITIDSASMANKGLEVIEAARLFDMPADNISVVIHPESRVHSFVRARDGSLYAQISRPDMRLPILAALAWPQVPDDNIADLDPAMAAMTFRPVDLARYPLLGLAYDALRAGEGATIAYNAANELAVEAFMDGLIGFMDLGSVVKSTLECGWPTLATDFDMVQAIDRHVRDTAVMIIKELQ